MAKKQSKYYVVWSGHSTGIFNSWEECQSAIHGYKGAQFKSFTNKQEAEKAFRDGSKQYSVTPQKSAKTAKIVPSLSVDAACSGNPGIMEYQGVNTATGERIFHQGPFEDGTNNIGEFLAIVHGLALLKKQNLGNMPIYTDSVTALSWIKKKKCNTTLPPTNRNKKLFEMITNAEKWLQSNSWHNPLLKWDTKSWGEIPADFGRK
jgi:ribonuclease HI